MAKPIQTLEMMATGATPQAAKGALTRKLNSEVGRGKYQEVGERVGPTEHGNLYVMSVNYQLIGDAAAKPNERPKTARPGTGYGPSAIENQIGDRYA